MRYSVYFIRKKSEQFDVDLHWAIARRLEYLTSLLAECDAYINKCRLSLLEDINFDTTLFVNTMLNDALIKKNAIQSDILSLQNYDSYNEKFKDNITMDDIDKAREYPIELLLPANRGKNICCPFHDDQHPSMGIKYNRARCFTCNKSWDPIQLLIDLHNLSFKEAVKYLSER